MSNSSSFLVIVVFLGALVAEEVALVVGLVVGLFNVVIYEHYKNRVKKGDKVLELHGEVEQIEKVKGGKLVTCKLDNGKGCILQGVLDPNEVNVGERVNIYIFTKDAGFPIPKAYRDMKLSEADKYRFKESWLVKDKEVIK